MAVCQECEETFWAPRSDARYCSSPCRQRAYRRRAAIRRALPTLAEFDAFAARVVAEVRALRVEP